jgi:hypothetical protein
MAKERKNENSDVDKEVLETNQINLVEKDTTTHDIFEK